MKKGLILLSVFLCGAGVLSAAEKCPRFQQYHRVFAIKQDQIDAARQAYPDSFRDGLIVATFVGLRLGAPEVREFENHRAFHAYFTGKGVNVQMCISSTLGHRDEWSLTNDLPKMVEFNGARAERLACPRSRPFHAYIDETFRRYAQLNPSVIWFDDDFRMAHHRPVQYPCFCESCVKTFQAETGVRLDRAKLVEAIVRDRTVGGVRVRQAWRDYGSRALTDLVKTAARAVRAVNDTTALGFMVCNPQGHGYAPPDFKKWSELGKNRDGIVYFRHGSGTYTDFTPYAYDSIVMKNISIGRLCAATEGPGVINLTEEVTCPYIRRAKSMKITFLEVALSIGLAGADGVTYDAIKPNLDEQLREGNVVSEMHRRDPELQRLYALVRGKKQIGLYPFFNQDVWLENPPKTRLSEIRAQGAEDWRALLYLGIPFTFRERDASLLLATRRSIRGMAKNDLKAWLARGVVADGEAADELERMFGPEVTRSPRVAVCCRGGKNRWSEDVWDAAASRRIKDRIDKLAGGRMPTRVDTAVRLAQSTWESRDGKERVVFFFNLDFDDAEDVRLMTDGTYEVSLLDAAEGTWTGLGTGDTFAVPTVPAWSVRAIRLRKK